MRGEFPLRWPMGWPRTERPTFSRFNVTFNTQVNELRHELRLLGAKSVVLTTNIPLRKDGLPYSNYRIEDPGVAVYFLLKGVEQCMPCDRWNKIQDNLRALVKTITALRGIERWGAKDMVNAAFRGFVALPDSSSVMSTSPQYFSECLDSGHARECYLRLCKELHPDTGADAREFVEMKRQYDLFKESLGVNVS